MIPKINFIGCGKLGKTIARLLVLNKQAAVISVLTSSFASASKAVHFIGQGKACSSFEEIEPADIYFIASPDDAIQAISEKLSDLGILEKNNLLVHFSGVQASDILSLAKSNECTIASIHPMRSFADPEEAAKSFKGTYCAMEGKGAGLEILVKLIENIGAVVFPINKEDKVKYHIAGVLANNYLVTLHHQAIACYQAAGIDKSLAGNMASSLMRDALSNLQQFPHEAALTGPIQRGDLRTIEKHLAALKNDPDTLRVYISLGLGTLALTQHSDELRKSIELSLKSAI